MAGLAAAYELQKTSVDWHLFEANDRLGGKIVTERESGFTIEAGPDSFITQKPWGLQLCRELGLEDELIPCNTARQKIHILVRGRLLALPEGFRLTMPTRIIPFLKSPLFSWRAKIRMGIEPLIPPRRDREDESITDFFHRRLGREAASLIGGPLLAGIYVANPDRLSLLSTFPMFREMERKHGSLWRAMRVAARRPASHLPMFMSLRGGMGQLVETIQGPIARHCQTGARVTAVQKQGNRFALDITSAQDAHRALFDAVIMAAPLHQAAPLLESVAPDAAAALRTIRYVSTATVSLGFRLPLRGATQPPDGFGFLIPAFEQRPVLACTWSSIKFDHRAPDQHLLCRAFVGGEGRENLVDLPDNELLELVRRELADITGISSEPVIARVYRWPLGNPQYDVGHMERMTELLADVSKIPGLYLAGSGYSGIGLPDCIRSGKEAAQKVTNPIPEHHSSAADADPSRISAER